MPVISVPWEGEKGDHKSNHSPGNLVTFRKNKIQIRLEIQLRDKALGSVPSTEKNKYSKSEHPHGCFLSNRKLGTCCLKDKPNYKCLQFSQHL